MHNNMRDVTAQESWKPMVGVAFDSANIVEEAKDLAGFGVMINDKTNVVYITIEGNDVRVRFDGTNPTFEKGHLIKVGAEVTWGKEMAKKAKFICDGLTMGATASVSQFTFGP